MNMLQKIDTDGISFSTFYQGVLKESEGLTDEPDLPHY